MQKTYRLANSQDTKTNLYNSTIQLNSSAQPFKKNDWVTLISCKLQNPYQISGYLIIQYKSKTSPFAIQRYQFQPSYQIMDTTDLQYQLNNGSLASYATFSISNNILSLTLKADNTANNTTTNEIKIFATGNTSILLGCLSEYTVTNIETPVIFSADNGFRIQFARLTSSNIYGSFQRISQYQLDSSTLAVMSRTDNFTFINKNLDTQMQITQQGNPYEFTIVDQDDREIKILQCFIEVQFIQDSYFIQRPSEKHMKQQVFLLLPQTKLTGSQNYQIDFSRNITQYSIVNAWGQIQNLTFTQQNSVAFYGATQYILYNEPEFLGWKNRLVNFDILQNLSQFLTRVSGSTQQVTYFNNQITVSTSMDSLFAVNNVNILYNLLKNNPTFRLGTTNQTYDLNQSNIFRYSTTYNIFSGDDVLPIKSLQTTSLVLEPIDTFTWTWQYQPQQNFINLYINEYIQNMQMQQIQVDCQIPNYFILRMFIK